MSGTCQRGRGWQAAKGQVLGVIDDDCSIHHMCLASCVLMQGADLDASRHVEGGGVSSWICPAQLMVPSHPTLRVIAGFVVRAICRIQNLIEVLARGKVGLTEACSVKGHQGESKVTSKQYVEYLHHLVRLRLAWGWDGSRLAVSVGRFIRF